MARFLFVIAALVCLLPAVSADEVLPEGVVARLGTYRWRPGGAVFALAFMPDGKGIVSAGRDGVSLWETSSGKELRRYEGHRWEVLCLALSPDGKSLATGSSDGTLRLWDVGSGKERKCLLERAGSIAAVAFSPKGKRLAAATTANRIHIWDLPAEREAGTFAGGMDGQRLAFTSDEQHLLVSGPGKTNGVELRKLPNGESVRSLGDNLHDFVLSPDGKRCAVATYSGRLVIHDLETGKPAVTMIGKLPELDRICLAYSPDGRTLAAASMHGTVRLWDPASGKLQLQFQAHAHWIYALAYSPNGKLLATAGVDQRIKLWDSATGKPLETSDAPDGPLWNAAFSPDGKKAATVGMDGVLRLWDTATGKASASILVPPGESSSVAWAPAGTVVALGNDYGQMYLLDTTTRKSLHALQVHKRRVTCLAFMPDSQGIVSGSEDQTLVLTDVKTGKPIRNFKTGQRTPITSLALSADGRLLFSAGTEARVRFWETATGKLAGEGKGHPGGVLSVCFAPEARMALSVGHDGLVRLWETATGKERRGLTGCRGWVWSAAWSRDGQFIATGHADGHVTVWNGRAGQRLRELPGHRGAVLSLAFSGDGSRLISTSNDATALVWDTSTMRVKLPEKVDLPAEKMAELWRELASEDAEAAGEAVQMLARSPKSAVALFRRHVHAVSEQELTGLISDLDSSKFPVRTRAMARLSSMGRFIEPRLREELNRKPSLEVRRRLEEILAVVTGDRQPVAEVRVLRALEVLEMVATDAAKELLKELAGGAASCELTIEAKGVLERLSKTGR
jgi:WD40 repeat protein